ncbi:MAG: DUF4760 domain-containing protein [Cyanophyceae cyanobacterium]
MVADHERRKKQATIEYVNSVKVKYRPIAEKLNQKFGERTIINIDSIDDVLKEDITEILSTLEHLAVGINSGVYELKILDRMSGTYFVNVFEKLSPYIRAARRQTDRRRLYYEFEEMVEDIRRMRSLDAKRIRQPGNIRHS